MIYFPLEGLAPGNYEMALTVQDEISGKTLDQREPFTIEASAK